MLAFSILMCIQIVLLKLIDCIYKLFHLCDKNLLGHHLCIDNHECLKWQLILSNLGFNSVSLLTALSIVGGSEEKHSIESYLGTTYFMCSNHQSTYHFM